MNVIFGAGGFAREVHWLIADAARAGLSQHDIDAFVVDDTVGDPDMSIHGACIVTETEFFGRYHDLPISIFIAVGSPKLKKVIYEKCIEGLKKVTFPKLIHPSVSYDVRPGAIELGPGVIVCAGSILTTDIALGSFVHVNLNCTIGHDVKIGSFSTLSPGAHISGRVSLGNSCFIGTGAVILENIEVPDKTIIGAGATVTKSLKVAGTYVGTPARLCQ